MSNQFQEVSLAEVCARLTKLERQNRVLKMAGAAQLIVAASLLLMAQTSPKKTIEANEFVLRDGSGNMRARLFMDEKALDARFVLFNNRAEKSVELTSGSFDATGGLTLMGRHDGELTGLGAGVLMFERPGDGTLSKSGMPTVYAELIRDRLYLSDSNGYSAVLGASRPFLGASQNEKTSAASLALFGKDRKVIWQAP